MPICNAMDHERHWNRPAWVRRMLAKDPLPPALSRSGSRQRYQPWPAVSHTGRDARLRGPFSGMPMSARV